MCLTYLALQKGFIGNIWQTMRCTAFILISHIWLGVDSSSHHHLVSVNNLHILYYNARNLLPKFDDLLLSIYTLKPQIICIVETWLSSDITDNEISIPGFQLFHNDRNRHGGGLLTYVSNLFFVTVLPFPTPPLETLTLSIFCNHFKVHLCLFYHPPSSTSLIFDHLCI